MTTWYTADLHLGHARILEYCQRPFADVDKMEASITERWNGVVKPDDTVWVLGDVALSTKSLGAVAKLTGRKILVAGNHDSCWEGHKRWRRAVQAYLDAGFAEVVTSGVVLGHVLCDRPGGPTVNLSHLPYRGDSRPEERYKDQRPVDDGRPLLCGHVHDAWKISGAQINVGVDVWNFQPVPEELLRILIQGL